MPLTIPLIAADGAKSTITLPDPVVTPPGGIIPAERNFAWNPGLTSRGGIPNRITIYKTMAVGSTQAQIQSALDTCPAGQVVQLAAGTFTINNFLLIHSSITLRGAGAGVTILKKTNGARARKTTVVPGTNGILTPVDPSTYTVDNQPIILVGPARWPGPDNSTAKNLTTDGIQGTNSVTITSAAGFTAGQFVLLDELSGASWQPTPTGFPGGAKVLAGDRAVWNMHNPVDGDNDDPNPDAKSWFCRLDRPICEIKEVASVSGNTITFTSPLTIGYRVNHTAQLTRFTQTGSQSGADSRHISNAGVENLTMLGGGDGALHFGCAAYSWAKNVEIAQWSGHGIDIYSSFRIEVRDSYIHTASWPEPGGAGYIIAGSEAASECLIENNIFIDANKVMVFFSSGAGSVVAYNYADDGWIFTSTDWVECGINASHMTGSHHVLFEGNYCFNADSDFTHGNAIYMTFFRNWLSGQRRSFGALDQGNVRCVGLAAYSWKDSFIGNILGRPGQMAGWVYEDPAMTGNNANWGDREIWKLGYDPERWEMFAEPVTLQTVIRDGNRDFLTNTQKWHNTPGGFAMPNSMYLTAKPSFFGSNPWPWTDPSTGTINVLPAKARYDAGTPNVI